MRGPNGAFYTSQGADLDTETDGKFFYTFTVAEPAHAKIVGQKDASEAQALCAEARRYPTGYYRLEWWDKREGPLPNPDVTYPELDAPAAFACTNGLCSLQVSTPDGVAAAIKFVEMR